MPASLAAVPGTDRAALAKARAHQARSLSTDKWWTWDDVDAIQRELVEYPSPLFHKVAILMLRVPEKIGSVHIDQQHAEKKSYASTVGVVLAVGPTAFKNEQLFPDGPAYAVGDVVQFPAYAGTKVSMIGAAGEPISIIFLNDDEITARWPRPASA